MKSSGKFTSINAYNSILHAYELFCQKVRRTDPEMSEVEHLSRMWERAQPRCKATEPCGVAAAPTGSRRLARRAARNLKVSNTMLILQQDADIKVRHDQETMLFREMNH